MSSMVPLRSLHGQQYVKPSLTFSYHKLVSCLKLLPDFHTLDAKDNIFKEPGGR